MGTRQEALFRELMVRGVKMKHIVQAIVMVGGPTVCLIVMLLVIFAHIPDSAGYATFGITHLAMGYVISTSGLGSQNNERRVDSNIHQE